MKIAVTSTGNTMDSMVDARFGRCAWFLIYDTETKSHNFLKNPAAEAQEGAGPVAVKFIAEQKVQKVVSGEFGVKVRPLLEELGIEMITNKESGKRVSEIINLFNH